MSDIEWFREKLAQLQIKEERTKTLNEIRSRLSNVELNLEQRDMASSLLTSSNILDYIDAENSSQNALVVDILSICMSNLNLSPVALDVPEIIGKSLLSSNPSVRAVGLKEIERVLNAKSPNTSFVNTELLLWVIPCLDSPNIVDSVVAISILSKVLGQHYMEPVVRQAFQQRLDGAELTRCRVYEIAINLSRQSPKLLEQIHPVIDRAISELDCDDTLLQLNILELLVGLAETNHGLTYLETKDFLKKLSANCEHFYQNPLHRLLLSGIFKFFGKIAVSHPENIISGYPLIMDYLFDCLEQRDPVLLPVAFDTLANLAHTHQGKLHLIVNYPEELQKTLTDLRSYMGNMPIELKIRLFNALEMIFFVEGTPNNQVSSFAEKLCNLLCNESHLDVLLEFCQNPFPELKIACLNFVKALCAFQWGVRLLRNTAGFLEYLLDRRVEFDSNVRMVKYELNSVLARSTVLDAQTVLSLQKYIAEGPHYVEAIVEVAVDGC